MRPIYQTEESTIKLTWRIDTNAIEDWVNKLKKADRAVKCQSGSYFSQEFGSPFVNLCFLGLFRRDLCGVIKQSHYSRCAKGSLQKMLVEGKLSLPQKNRITQILLQQLVQWHSKGLLHQDLTLENVLLDEDERWRLARV